MIARSCEPLSERQRLDEYDARVKAQPGYERMAHDARIAHGMRRRAEIVNFPIAKHRSLVVIPQPKRARRKRGAK